MPHLPPFASACWQGLVVAEKNLAAAAAAQGDERGQTRNGKSATSGSKSDASTNADSSWQARMEAHQDLILSLLQRLVERETVKDWYGTDEVAKIAKKSEYTVRNWCLEGRLKAEKKGSGRGKYQSWVISHTELQRYQKEGLLPPRKP